MVYHFPLDEDKNATIIKDISSTKKVKSFDKPLSSQLKLSAVTSSVATVKNYAFQVRGTDAIKSDRQYYIQI